MGQKKKSRGNISISLLQNYITLEEKRLWDQDHIKIPNEEIGFCSRG